jgi:hypothetical protein
MITLIAFALPWAVLFIVVTEVEHGQWLRYAYGNRGFRRMSSLTRALVIDWNVVQ